jgi:cell surface protein SprA
VSDPKVCTAHGRPALRLGVLFALVLAGAGTLLYPGFALGVSGTGPTLTPRGPQRPVATSDTDSVAVGVRPHFLDSLRADTARADSLPPDTGRAAVYAPRMRELPYARLGRRNPFLPPLVGAWRTDVALDSTALRYRIRERVGDEDVRLPVTVGFDAYRALRRDLALDRTYRELLTQRARQTAQRRGGLGLSIVVPGGRQSAFSTIFGKNEVSLRVSGQADINAGFESRYSERQQAVSSRGTQIDPAFQQDLRLGVVGTIGDKMRINVDWDTRNQFDYQNQVSLRYTGYEDEIVQSVEAGNVLLQTPSTLIRGGQSLFGIKSELRLGGLRLTTVASQQKGQGSTLSITGGAEQQTFSVASSDYDDGRHYFLAYYFRNAWDTVHAQPPNAVTLAQGDDGRPGVQRIEDVEVWRFTPLNPNEQNFKKVVALVDLGEEPAVTRQTPDAPYRRRVAPNPDLDRYAEAALDANVRRRSVDTVSVDRYLQQQGLRDYDFQTGSFKRLVPQRDYFLDKTFGYVSLNQALGDNEALAVSYTYLDQNGRKIQVGDFATDGTVGGNASENALVLKLLRRKSPQAPGANLLPAAWPLEMRNIYSLRGRGLDPQDFNLTVEYEPPGSAPSQQLPVAATGARTLLTITGLDRLGAGDRPGADNRFDYLAGYTIDASRGLIIFPYVEPFGSRIASAVGNSPQAASLVYRELYLQKQEEARRNTLLDVYRIRGKYQGSVQSFFDLRAFSGLIQGSVQVRSGGVQLAENTDFTVDYTAGTVTITNPAFLTAGRNIEIDYEQNQLFTLQQKTLLGVRADYDFGRDLQLGATMMRLTQRSPVDKFRIGDEPVQNTIWGVDGRYQAEQPWLTRLVDRLPLLQTRAPSRLTVQAEFAQLRPGNPQTVAFRQQRQQLRDKGDDFFEDELRGVSFIDDFESFENAYSLKQPGTWSLSSAPDSIPAVDGAGRLTSSFADSLRTTYRAGLAWYSLTRDLGVDQSDPAVAHLRIQDVYDVDVAGRDPQQQLLTTFDMYFTPFFRGPFNYNQNLPGFFASPKKNWGGMITRIPDQYTDFGLKNVEFIEFVVRPVSAASGGDAGNDAYLFVDLGRISEDVLPDGRDNSEDGLSLESVNPNTLTPWGRVPSGTPDRALAIDEVTRRTEDVGLDGLASYNAAAYDPAFLESTRFRAFLAALPESPTGDARLDAEVARSRADPSGDDYHHYLDTDYFGSRDVRTPFFPNGANVQDRFLRFFPASELNSFEGQSKLAQGSAKPTGNSQRPDTEDLNESGNTNRENTYLQYRIPLSQAALRTLSSPEAVDDYVVGETKQGSGFYLVRIPVRQPTRCVGLTCSALEVQSFLSNVESIRMWTTGHAAPVTMRFAAFDLVSSQWQKSTRLTTERVAQDPFAAETRFSISSYNTEENPSIYKSPIGTVTNQLRSASGGRAGTDREQTLVLRTENLRGGRQRAIYKTYTTGLDLLKYEHVRLFTHFDAKDALGRDLTESDRGRAAVFVRLGSNEGSDYFELEQPLVPSPVVIGTPDPARLWPEDNAVNILLRALNQLKAERDNRLTAASDDQRSYLNRTFYNVGPDGRPVSGAPDAEDFSPPGTRLGIRGNPTLGKVTTIIVGLRSLEDSTSMSANLTEANLWVNELRVTGYDETNGWSAVGNLDLTVADLATVRASIQTQTDGFGALASTLGERDQNALLSYSVTAQLNADKLLPAQSGWSIPVNVALQERANTPRFAPNRGGIPLEDVLAGIADRTVDEAGNPLSDDDRAALRRTELEAAQDASSTRSLSVSVSKRGSRSVWLQRTLDAVQFTYSTANSSARTPSTAFNDAWNWNGGLGYRLAGLPAKTVRPLWFLDDVPVARLLAGLRFNYVPSQLSTDLQATRSFAAARDRKPLIEAPSAVKPLPDLVRFPFREQHAFAHGRTFTLGYSPFSFLTTQFDSRVQQNLGLVGVDTLYNLVRRSDGTARLVSRAEAFAAESDTSVFVQTRIDALPTGRVLGRVFSGDDRFRTDTYGQNFTATLRLTLPRALDFFRFERASYNAQYGWQNAPIGQGIGAGVNSNVQFNTDASLSPQALLRKFPFYRALEREQERIDARARAAREARETLRREQRERERREREARRDAERRARELGIPVDSLLARPDSTAPPAVPLPSLPPATPVAPPPDTSAGGDLPDKTRLREQARQEIVQAGAPEDTTAVTAEQRRGFRLPLPSPRTLLRRTLLTLGGVTGIRFSYNGTFQSQNASVTGGSDSTGTPYSFLDALRGQGPSLGYRFGLERRLPLDDRLLPRNLQVSDVLSDNHTLNATTELSPSPVLRVSLSWQAGVQQQQTYSIRGGANGIEETLNAQGTTRAYVWAFGANFDRFFERQVATLRGDLDAAGSADTLRDADGNGRIALTPQTLAADFRDAFSRTPFGSLDGRGFLPIPLPSWQITYTGAAKWPILRLLASSISIRSSYNAEYSVPGFRSTSLPQEKSFQLNLGDAGTRRIAYLEPRDDATTINVNERYAPLVGASVTFKNNLTTEFNVNKSSTYGLQTTGILENHTDELSLAVNYSRQGLKLPFIRSRLNNRVTFSLQLQRSVSANLTYNTDKAISDAIVLGLTADGARGVDYTTRSQDFTRLTLSPTIGYQFSNSVQGNFTFRLERFNSAVSAQPDYTNMSGLFNIRVNITSY